MRQRLAECILFLYPKAWRDRYEPEMRELLRQSPLRWRDVGDLMWAVGSEWVTRLASPRMRVALSVAYVALVLTWTAAEFVADLITLTVRGYNTSVLWPDVLSSLFRVTPKMAVVYVGPGFLLGAVVYLVVVRARWGAVIQSQMPSCFAPVTFMLWGVGELLVVYGPHAFQFFLRIVLPWALAWAAAGMVVGRFAPSDRPVRGGIARR